MAQILNMPTRSKVLALRCTACGVEASASCSCGVAYEPASAVAARALEAHPEKSNRAIAEIAGVGRATVNRLRATGSFEPVERTIGLDGKERPAVMPSRPKPEVVVLDPLDYTFQMFLDHVLIHFNELDDADKAAFWRRVRKEIGYDF